MLVGTPDRSVRDGWKGTLFCGLPGAGTLPNWSVHRCVPYNFNEKSNRCPALFNMPETFSGASSCGAVSYTLLVKDTAPQERIGKLLLGVGGNDDNRTAGSPDRLACFRDVKLHPVKLPEQVVWKFDICFICLLYTSSGSHSLSVSGDGQPWRCYCERTA